MPDRIEKRALQLSWNKVCDIVSAEIEKILGSQFPCGVNVVVDDVTWTVKFDGCRMPLSGLCQLLQITQATPEDWAIALPSDGERDVSDIGMELAEKLIGRHLNLTWEKHLITEDSLWLVGVTDICKPSLDSDGSSLPNDMVQALVDIADYLRRQKDRGGD